MIKFKVPLLAGLLALLCIEIAAPTLTLAQSEGQLPVKDGTGAAQSIDGQVDAATHFHYRDIFEGLDASGNPVAVVLKAASTPPTAADRALVVADYQDASFAGAVAMTVGTTYAPQRAIGANCSVAGNMSVTFVDASTLAVPVQVGFQTFPFAVTAVNTGGTTATCTYVNLK
jgi:hypothetical protein